MLSNTQTLRDKHSAITYNRSDCQYLSEEQYKEAPDTMQQVMQNISYTPPELDMSLHKKCFDDSRISAHTAIIPQNKAVDLKALSERERKVYLAICKYYMAQFFSSGEERQDDPYRSIAGWRSVEGGVNSRIKSGMFKTISWR